KLFLPSSGFGPELAKEIEGYPYYGDVAKVRPSVRATEGALSGPGQPQRTWPIKFWGQCLRDTPCFSLKTEPWQPKPSPSSDVQRVKRGWNELLAHWQKTTTTTAVDSRHDTAFGLSLFCLAILEELLRIGNSQSVIARPALRSIVEAYITLAYLMRKDQQELWKSQR